MFNNYCHGECLVLQLAIKIVNPPSVKEHLDLAYWFIRSNGYTHIVAQLA